MNSKQTPLSFLLYETNTNTVFEEQPSTSSRLELQASEPVRKVRMKCAGPIRYQPNVKLRRESEVLDSKSSQDSKEMMSQNMSFRPISGGGCTALSGTILRRRLL